MIIPTKKWKKLLQKAAGKDIFIRITLLRGGKWTRYADIKDTISNEPIDEYLSTGCCTRDMNYGTKWGFTRET